LKTKLDYTELNILDLGCSEGQALKMLHDLGCRKLGGVEIRKELYEVCQNNMIDCNIAVKLYNIDIRNFDLLMEFDVIYMYNPFSIDIMQEFIENLLKIKKKYLFIYINSVHENYFFNLAKVKINVFDRATDIWGNNILVFEFIPDE
jgi:predicted RNA methylase